MKRILLVLAVLVIAATLYAQAPVRFDTKTYYYNSTRSAWQTYNAYDTISMTTHQTVWLPAIDLYNGYASIEADYIIGSNDSITVYAAISDYPAALTPCGSDTAIFKLNKTDSVTVVAAAYAKKTFNFAGRFGKSLVLWIYNESSTASALSRLVTSVQ